MSETDDLEVTGGRRDERWTAACDEEASLLAQCAELVDLLKTINSEDGPYNRAELQHLSPDQVEAARRLQLCFFERVDCLAENIGNTTATCVAEHEAKLEAYDMLVEAMSWDSQSLCGFRKSLDRDLHHLAVIAGASSRSRGHRPSWLSRISSLVW